MYKINKIPHDLVETIDKYDELCKKNFSYKEILAWILKDVLDECKDLSIPEIIAGIEPNHSHDKIVGFNIEDEFISEARIYFDLVFLVRYHDQPILINLEAQSYRVSYQLQRRGLYYGCRLIDRQKNHALGFQGSDFDSMIPVTSVWARNDEPRDTQNIEKHQMLNLLRLVFVYPLKELDFTRHPPSAPELLSLLFGTEISYSEKKQILASRYGIMMTEGLEKEMRDMCTFGEGLWNRALNTGMKQGMEQGMEQGIGKGAEDALKKALSSLLKHQPDLSLEKAMDMLDIPLEKRKTFLSDPDFQKFH